MTSLILPMITLDPDPVWMDEATGYKNLVGGVLMVVVVLAVAALAISGVLLAASRTGMTGVRLSSDILLKVVLVAMLAGSISGIAAYSFKFDLKLGDFSSDPAALIKPKKNPHPIVAPDYCESWTFFYQPKC